MNLIPWKHHGLTGKDKQRQADNDIQRLKQSIDRVFEQFWSHPMSLLSNEAFEHAGLMPRVEVKDKKKEIVVHAELPGMSAEDVEVEVNDNILTITGEKSEELDSEDGDSFYSERRFGRFSRSIELPGGIDLDSIDAQAKNGVLTVRIRKTAPKHVKRVPVGASA